MASMVRATSSGARPTEGSSTSRISGASITALARFGQAGERLEAEIRMPLDLRARLRPEGAQQQIFFYRQFREQPAAFRHQRDAEIDDLLGSHSDKVMLLAVDFRDDAAGGRAHDAHDAFHQRAFAVAIGAEQS